MNKAVAKITSQSSTTPVTSPIRRFVTNTLNYLPAALLPALIALASSATFTRIFTANDYGILSLLLAIIAPIATMLTEWIGQPVGRFYAEYKHNNRLELYRSAVVIVLFSTVIWIVLVALLALAGLLFFNGGIPYPLLLVGTVIGLLVQSWYSILIRILPASFKIQPYRNVVVLMSVLSLIITLALIHFFGINIAWLVWGPALSTGLLLPYILRHAGIALKINRADFGVRTQKTLLRFWHYGAPMMIWFFANQLLNIGDRYIIQIYLDSTQLGIYSVNYNLVSQAVNLVNVPLWAASGPILMSQWARREISSVCQTISQMTDIYMIIGFGMIGGIGVIGEFLTLIIFGSEFHEGYIIFVPVLAGAVVFGVTILGQKSVEFTEKTSIMVYIILIAALANLILNIKFVPIWGYQAAAFTTLISYLIYLLLVYWGTQYLLPWNIPIKKITISACASFVAWFLASLILEYIQWGAFIQLIVGGTFFSLIYITTIAVMRYNELYPLTMYWLNNILKR